MIHVVGNAVLDMPLRYAPVWSDDTADGWTASNVHFLENPVDGILGGCGAATAYVLGRLGNKVSLNTRLGADAFGGVIKGWLDGAKVHLVNTSVGHTAVNVIPMREDGTRQSLYYTGQKIDWKQSVDVDCDIFFASGYGQVDPEDIGILAEVFAHMQARDIPVVFDPGPWFMMHAKKQAMHRAWACVDVLVGTQDELNTWAKRDSVSDLMVHLCASVSGDVVVKQGRDGAAFCGRDGVSGQVETDSVEQAYTVGAGDTFNAGLLHALHKGEGLCEAVAFAVDVATRVVRRGRGALGVMD